MRVDTLKHYDKAWVKLKKGQQEKALLAIELLMREPSNKLIRLHQLKGSLYPQYSISAGGDLRIHFFKTSKDSILLTAVGTHAQLYE